MDGFTARTAVQPPRPAPSSAPLRLTRPGDALETEADQRAAQVMQAAAPAIGTLVPPRPASPSYLPRDGDLVGLDRGCGQPLDANTRAWFEPRFAHHFGDVRIHSGERAAASAERLDALAYTVHNHVVLGADAPRLDSPDGRRLLAHELAHVLQQRRPSHAGVVARQKKAPTTDHQATSWSSPHGDPPVIAQVFFTTNGIDLSADDTRALKRIAEAINAHEGALIPPIKIRFEGYADPRTTSYKGGNGKLAYDRAEACESALRAALSRDGLSNVTLSSRSKGVDEALKHSPHRYQRMVLVTVEERIPPKKKRRPAKSCKAAKQRCRRILIDHHRRFSTLEQRHLSHLLKDSTTEDGFLNALDPELIKIAYGLRGAMTDEEAKAFVNRFQVCTDLKHPSFAGPDATDEDVLQALKGLHERIDGALDHLAKGTAKDMISGGANQRRVKLNHYVDQARKRPNNLYFKW